MEGIQLTGVMHSGILGINESALILKNLGTRQGLFQLTVIERQAIAKAVSILEEWSKDK